MHPAVARVAALRALMEVTGRRCCDSGDILNRIIAEMGLDDRDARLATALALAVLRHRGFLTYQVHRFVNRRPRRDVALILEMVAAQRFLLERIPAHAAVDDAVRLATVTVHLGLREAGFVNAVARRITAARAPALPPADKRDQYLSVRYSCPPALLRLLKARFDDAITEKLLSVLNHEPSVALRVNRLKTTRDNLQVALAAAGIETRPGRWSPDALLLTNAGNLTALLRSDFWMRGLFYVQDEASQLVALLAAPRPGERILDLCAAPGGKCLHAAEIAGGTTLIVATDASPARLELLAQNAKRLGTSGLEIRPGNLLNDRQRFDLVFVDAPCSGLGTIRRHPEIKERIARVGLPDLARHQQRQVHLLCRAASQTAPGGRIAYSTCSFADEENAGAVAVFLKQHPAFEVVRDGPVPGALVPLMAPDGFLRTWPVALDDTDGFEMCILRRRS